MGASLALTLRNCDSVLWAPFFMSHLTHLAGPPQGISGQDTRRDCGSGTDRLLGNVPERRYLQYFLKHRK